MILGLLSDTHDRLARTERAVSLLIDAGAEVLVHCGDLTRPEIVRICGVRPCHYVLGNNDFDVSGIRAAIEETGGGFLGLGGELALAGRRIGVTHGHRIGEVHRLAASGPDYLALGHSHLAADDRRGGIRWINPGALHRAPTPTVARLDLARDELTFLNVD